MATRAAIPSLGVMRRVLVTGAGGWTGSRVVQVLEQRPDLEVFAVDDSEPRLEFSSEFQRLSLDRLALAHLVLDVEPHTIVHTQTVDRSAKLGGRVAHDDAVIGAQALFGAIARCKATRRVIVKSDAAVYGSSPRNPSVLAESTRGRGSTDRYQSELLDMEAFVRETAATHEHVDYTILRFAPIFGPTVANPISRFLTLPSVPTVLGYDPRMQFVYEEDAVRAIVHAMDSGVAGTYNIAAPGQLFLSRVLRLGLRVPQPLPGRVFDSALRGLARINLPIPEHVAMLLKHGRVMDTTAMRERLRFQPSLNCRQVVLAAYGRMPKVEAA